MEHKCRSIVLPVHVYEGDFTFLSQMRRKELLVKSVMEDFGLKASDYLRLELYPRTSPLVKQRLEQEFRKAGIKV